MLLEICILANLDTVMSILHTDTNVQLYCVATYMLAKNDQIAAH